MKGFVSKAKTLPIGQGLVVEHVPLQTDSVTEHRTEVQPCSWERTVCGDTPLVRAWGLEPQRGQHENLNLACLPIPSCPLIKLYGHHNTLQSVCQL